MADSAQERATEALREFARERDWEQFHNPKNLVMALAGEVGELVAVFQWLSPEEAALVMGEEKRAAEVRAELADVYGYLLLLVDALRIDVNEALSEKMRESAKRYTVEESRGVAIKQPHCSS